METTKLVDLVTSYGISIESFWTNEKELLAKLRQFDFPYQSLQEVLKRYPNSTKGLRYDLSVTLSLPDGSSLITDFHMGLGHAKKPNLRGLYNARFALEPELPTPADVLYCLASDARALSLSFEQWVDEYGITDAKTAWKTYQACQEISTRLLGWIGHCKVEAIQNAEH